MMGFWGQEWKVCEYCQVLSVGFVGARIALSSALASLTHIRSGCQGGLRFISQSKATFFGQRGESHRLSLEVPALEQPEIA